MFRGVLEKMRHVHKGLIPTHLQGFRFLDRRREDVQDLDRVFPGEPIAS